VVFVAIVTAIILQGVLGVLVVVPLLATLGVIGRYLRRRLLGLQPFEEDEPPHFRDPEADSDSSSGPKPVRPIP
jgi:hypothetical protein